MDLTIPVRLKNDPVDFEDYCNTIEKEQVSSISWMTAPDARWNVPDSLKAKVDKEGKLRPFFGDTIVIPNEEADISRLGKFKDELHNLVGELCAFPLIPEHFHITLHDLTSGTGRENLTDKMENNSEKCRQIFKTIAEYLHKNDDQAKIRLTSTYAYPSCNISVVLGFAPKTDKDYRIIMNLYNLFDDVVYLSYWLRMHLTLAYFKPFEFFRGQMLRLMNALNSLNHNRIEIELDLWKMAYQRFDDMNDYKTIFSLADFR